jgi:NTE family protein
MGAVCGALYAAGLPAAHIRAHFEELLANPARFLRRMAGKLPGGFTSLWSPRKPSVVDNVTLFEMLLPTALRCDFAALKIPFLAIATDFYANRQVVLSSGPVIPALAASCALPALSRPVMAGGRLLIDGGYLNPLPYDIVMAHADLTVAVDVTAVRRWPAGTEVARPGTLQLLAGATQMLFCALTAEKLRSSAPDVLIRPPVDGFAALDFFRIAEIFAAAVPAKRELKDRLARWLEPTDAA